MKNNLSTLLLILFISVRLLSQTIDFQQPEILFQHPNSLFGNTIAAIHPFTPFNINDDKITDFIGNVQLEGSTRAIYTMLGQLDGEFHKDSLLTENSAVFVQEADLNNDTTNDILFSDRIIFRPSMETLVIPLPDIYDSYITKDTYIGSGDFNGDNINDIVTRRLIRCEDNELAIFLSNPNDNTYENLVLYSTDDFGPIKIVDFNQDGFLDLIYTSILDLDMQDITIALGDGKGGFNEQYLATDDDYNIFSSIEVIDVDNDNDLDFIMSVRQGLQVYVNEGSDSYQEIFFAPLFENLIQIPELPVLFRVADFNKDGAFDVVFWAFDGSIYYSQNNRVDGFEKARELADLDVPFLFYSRDYFFDLDRYAQNFNILDFDDDGDLDITYTYDEGGSQQLIRSDIISNTNNAFLESIKIHPNPNNGHFQIHYTDSQNYNWVINTIEGLKISSGTSSISNNINLPHKGVYFLTIENETSDKRSTYKIVNQ